MFDWFRKRRAPILKFSDNSAAFAHACSHGVQPLLGSLVPALVEKEGERGCDGEHTFLIRLAGPGRAITFWSCTLKESRSYPRAGDLVGFRVVLIASDLPEDASLIGYIACRLEPVLTPAKGWTISQNYTPPDIKQAIRL